MATIFRNAVDRATRIRWMRLGPAMQNFPNAVAADPSAAPDDARQPVDRQQDSIRADLSVILRSLRERAHNPAVGLGAAVGAGLVTASLLSLVVEAVFAIHWWTALIYMAAFFTTGVWTYRRLSPEGARIATDGSRRYLEDSGTLDLFDAARELARSSR